MKIFLGVIFIIISTSLFASEDNRILKNSQSPVVLDAIGKLYVENNDNTISQCSGSLIHNIKNEASNFLITATHCLNKGIKGTWSTITVNNKLIERKFSMKQVKNLGSDVSLIILKNEIPFLDIKPLLFDHHISFDNLNFNNHYLIIAGFPLDSKSNNGLTLSYDVISDKKKINVHKKVLKAHYHYDKSKKYSLGYKDWKVLETPIFSGLSGGAAFYGNLKDNEQHYFLGVAVTQFDHNKIISKNGKIGATKAVFSDLVFFDRILSFHFANETLKYIY